MATLTIRNLSEDTSARLRTLAAQRGHSMEEEARRILNRAVSESGRKGLGTHIAQQFAGIDGTVFSIPKRSPHRPPPNLADGTE